MVPKQIINKIVIDFLTVLIKINSHSTGVKKILEFRKDDKFVI